MENNYYKYKKYKTKYIENKHELNINNNQDGGDKKLNIIILHNPTINSASQIPDELKPIITKLNNYGNVHNYWIKFTREKFNLDDLLFENVAKDIHKTYKHLSNFIIIALGHACPFGLYYSYHYLIKHLKNMKLKPNDTIWSFDKYHHMQYRTHKLRQKIGKPYIHLHSFRKSRATYNDSIGMGFYNVCTFGGWKPGSRTLQHYITSTGRSMLPVINKLNQ